MKVREEKKRQTADMEGKRVITLYTIIDILLYRLNK